MENLHKHKSIDHKFYIEEGIFLVHKPRGMSSFALVSRMRNILKTRKIGHAGTLDPLATGLMIMGVNKGTKKLKNYVGLDKVYLAEILIGQSTRTGDAEGEIVEEKIPDPLFMKESDIDDAFQSLLGESYYPAPLYSAVKVLGKPLYKYAREGVQPPYIPDKKMHVHNVQIVDLYKKGLFYIVKVRVRVGSGTYIRTLAEEFGKKINYPAHLHKLYRVSIGEYLDQNAFRLDDFQNIKINVIMEIYQLIKKAYEYFFPNKKS